MLQFSKLTVILISTDFLYSNLFAVPDRSCVRRLGALPLNLEVAMTGGVESRFEVQDGVARWDCWSTCSKKTGN